MSSRGRCVLIETTIMRMADVGGVLRGRREGLKQQLLIINS
jgi:hypothetical protein